MGQEVALLRRGMGIHIHMANRARFHFCFQASSVLAVWLIWVALKLLNRFFFSIHSKFHIYHLGTLV